MTIKETAKAAPKKVTKNATSTKVEVKTVAPAIHRENAYLNDKHIEKIKRVLLSEKEKILGKKRDEESFHLDRNELSDPNDEASMNQLASQELRFRNREEFYLKKINKSLSAVERGVYGLCDDCGVEIGFERLMARPTAEMCITCKEEAELTERSNFFLKKSKSLGKNFNEQMNGRA
jgi:DnaK suppressor protein